MTMYKDFSYRNLKNEQRAGKKSTMKSFQRQTHKKMKKLCHSCDVFPLIKFSTFIYLPPLSHLLFNHSTVFFRIFLFFILFVVLKKFISIYNFSFCTFFLFFFHNSIIKTLSSFFITFYAHIHTPHASSSITR